VRILMRVAHELLPGPLAFSDREQMMGRMAVVLVIDDEPEVRDVVCELLESGDIRPSRAAMGLSPSLMWLA
jgi:hypothetical protein